MAGGAHRGPVKQAMARAKVNLSLRIAGRRPDGYHELESLVVFPDTGDRLTVDLAADLTLDVEGPFADGLTGEADNLVLRAARALRAETGSNKGAWITLDKWLPVASGIGGGSADAAAALNLLNELWEAGLDHEALARIALELGADVPVCLDAAPAFMTGIGERVARLPALPDFVLLLVNPGVAVPTGKVFARLDAAALTEGRGEAPRRLSRRSISFFNGSPAIRTIWKHRPWRSHRQSAWYSESSIRCPAHCWPACPARARPVLRSSAIETTHRTRSPSCRRIIPAGGASPRPWRRGRAGEFFCRCRAAIV